MSKKISVITKSIRNFEKYLKNRLWCEYTISFDNIIGGLSVENLKVKAVTVHNEEFYMTPHPDYFSGIIFDEVIDLKKHNYD